VAAVKQADPGMFLSQNHQTPFAASKSAGSRKIKLAKLGPRAYISFKHSWTN
jgi:hypothetical protein